MKKKVITIDKDKCVGCGLCTQACQEGAIGLVDGKAELLHEDYCDGLGNCLPVCPTNAISFQESDSESVPSGCPGSKSQALKKRNVEIGEGELDGEKSEAVAPPQDCSDSELMQWPVQIQLVSTTAGYFDNADLLIAADCTAYAYADFHKEMMKGRVTLIGCPKLDSMDYTEKLTEIIKENNIRSVTVARMEVPCCGGLQYAVEQAITDSGKRLPSQTITITTDGNIL